MGIYDYPIFLDEEMSVLYAIQKIKGDGNPQDLGNIEIVQRWWAYMTDIMETNPDNSPISISLTEVFYFE